VGTPAKRESSTPENQESVADKKTRIKQKQYEAIASNYKFVKFKGATLFERDKRFIPLTSDNFASAFYELFPFAAIQQIKEVEHRVRASSPDLSNLDYLIDFGGSIWDARKLEWLSGDPDTVLRSRVAPNPDARAKALAYMLELSNQNEELAWDMLQGVAPLFMEKKPAGVIWFIGGGANGKSAFIDAIYKIVGDHLTSMTVASIEDGRDTPRLNGVIGNVCRESSEGRVEDTERYKAIGTHEPFDVHKFHSQDSVRIDTQFHTIFNANNIPIFSDKTEGARRRTLIIPFPAHFKDDPGFEERTFTPDFLGGLLTLILEATQIIKNNGYQYRFSKATQGAKADYDAEVNSAEAFLEHLREKKVKAFTNYHLLRMAYESWCQDEGLVPLGVTNLKRVMTSIAGAESMVFRNRADGNKTCRWYFIDGYQGDSLQSPGDAFNLVGLKIPVGEKVEEPEGATKSEQTPLSKDW
jgi:phage/plasmid-associated DNA primase